MTQPRNPTGTHSLFGRRAPEPTTELLPGEIDRGRAADRGSGEQHPERRGVVPNGYEPPAPHDARTGRSNGHRTGFGALRLAADDAAPPTPTAAGTDGPPVDLPPNEADDTGWTLVRAVQGGDTDAFGRLYDRYHEVVFRFVLFRVSDRGLAEDVTHETFLRAFRRISSVSYQGRDIGAWFITIARNLVLDHVKSSRYRLEVTTAEVADVGAHVSPSPEHEVVTGATHEELLRCVARLNADQQECIALRFLQGLSVAETARLMNRNEGAVKALQHRAVRRLAHLLPEGLR